MSNVLYMLHMTGVSRRMYMMYLSLFSGVLRTVFERYLCIVYACRTNENGIRIRCDTIKEFNVDSTAECDQVDVAHLTRKTTEQRRDKNKETTALMLCSVTGDLLLLLQ